MIPLLQHLDACYVERKHGARAAHAAFAEALKGTPALVAEAQAHLAAITSDNVQAKCHVSRVQAVVLKEMLGG